jgi:hypothetical protein
VSRAEVARAAAARAAVARARKRSVVRTMVCKPCASAPLAKAVGIGLSSSAAATGAVTGAVTGNAGVRRAQQQGDAGRSAQYEPSMNGVRYWLAQLRLAATQRGLS